MVCYLCSDGIRIGKPTGIINNFRIFDWSRYIFDGIWDETYALDTPSSDDGSDINELDDSPNYKLPLNNDMIIVEYLCNTDAIDFSI